MPAFRSGDDDRALLFDAERGHGFGLGLRQRIHFDHLPFAVEPIEFGGDLRRLIRIVFQQQPHAEIGTADAAARIDARAQQKSEMPGLGRPGEARHVHQADVARALPAAQSDQALSDEGSVEPDQRHDVGHGAERDIVQKCQKIEAPVARWSRTRVCAVRD